MTLLEALSKRYETPIVITESPWGDKGRQYRWCNGHIQTKTQKGKYWNRIINISVAILETAKAEFINEQPEQKDVK